MPSRPFKVERAADPAVRYEKYRISTKGQQSWSDTHKFLTIAALTAMLADSRNKASSKGDGDNKDWDVCHIKFSLADGKSTTHKAGNEIFRKVDSNLLWIDNHRQLR
ncbi:hypothetical protein TWF173_011030 [Orbilia oligospora]|uniref:Uncharacterized protein n=2 Tax=Orbilia oligospora TaxID=2813651 RepID=G1XNA6_ARTOA|nr:hypothetical protein AOL_s00170g72 [Orbilia oligospora ATCC 24927]EGX45365.1 hypothetical protein AOL_s00170g72 [Orbilia oligospora ATCC 24927]KAF3274261.1 hypothetical protein TWF970_008012 [Orbilia oligospora]KAF3317378.1 hypothetical protein TWF173_011030 [Orbilia oligospora]